MAENCPACGTKHDSPGALRQYYNDLASGKIVPEDMRIEDLEFRIQISATGQVLSESPAVMVVSLYNFALRRIKGFVMDPEVAGAAPSLIRFNVRDQGRNFSVFKKPVNLQSAIGNVVAEWDGTFIMVPGAQLAVDWTVDTQRWAALVGASKEVGVQLLGDYVACALKG